MEQNENRVHSKKDYSYVLFDLDGTLTDSGPGIVNGFVYAIEKMGREVGDREALKKFIGPPLKDSFGNVLGYSPEDTEEAIAFYREYYNGMGGNLENSVYQGVKEMLMALKEAGMQLIVATSKGAHGTEVVLQHFGLRQFFDFIASSNDTDRTSKKLVISYALEQCGITDISQAVMVGDRHYDIGAAAELGLDSVGVLYGYGNEEELRGAGATYLANTPEEVSSIILDSSIKPVHNSKIEKTPGSGEPVKIDADIK